MTLQEWQERIANREAKIDDDQYHFLCIPEYKPFYGYLLPNGCAITCLQYEHIGIELRVGKTQRELELEGWVKLAQGPAIPGTGTFFLKTYSLAYACKKLTREQKIWLDGVGFFYVDTDSAGIERFAFKPE